MTSREDYSALFQVLDCARPLFIMMVDLTAGRSPDSFVQRINERCTRRTIKYMDDSAKEQDHGKSGVLRPTSLEAAQDLALRGAWSKSYEKGSM